MRLTALTDYALRVLIYAGLHRSRLCTIREIAQSHGISQAHLMKVSQLLAQHGWITTIRGKNGGLQLSQAPELINLGAVVQSIEPNFELVECFGLDNACQLASQCALTFMMHGALKAFLHHLDKYTLADVLTPLGNPPINHCSEK